MGRSETNIRRTVASDTMRMTPSKTFVETRVANGVTEVFGIVCSACMDDLDIFPTAGIRYIPTLHERGAAHMADGYARVSGRHGACMAQNGPGITNFVTVVAAAHWAHSPVMLTTLERGAMSVALSGFQETDQLPIFSKIAKDSPYMSPAAHPGTGRPVPPRRLVQAGAFARQIFEVCLMLQPRPARERTVDRPPAV